MTDDVQVLEYVIKDPIELNLSYMPFINHGGLFIPTDKTLALGQLVIVNLLLPGKNAPLKIEGKIIWITPKNALHHVLPGVGMQINDANEPDIRNQIEAALDPKMEVGGYTYGITEETKRT
jgi:type IV pilus assembly protein PilZ